MLCRVTLFSYQVINDNINRKIYAEKQASCNLNIKWKIKYLPPKEVNWNTQKDFEDKESNLPHFYWSLIF